MLDLILDIAASINIIFMLRHLKLRISHCRMRNSGVATLEQILVAMRYSVTFDRGIHGNCC